MGNQFTALPAPAGNGPGTPVDVSTFGLLKTVTYVAPAPPFLFKPTVIIEFSNEFVPVHFAPLAVLGQPDEVTIPVAAHWMRATVANYKGGGAPVVNVGANDSAPSFATLIAPPGSGAGVGVDVSSMGAIKTIHVATVFRGALNIEISEDGGATYNQICTFYGPGHKTLTFAADFMRATRVGVPQSTPGTPIINIGAASDSGGGLSGLTVEDEGVALGLFTTMNFLGAGVTATDAGGGTVDVTIPGGGGSNTVDVEDEGTPLGSFTTVNFTGDGITATDAGGGVAQVDVPIPTSEIFVLDEGVPLVLKYFALNFVGAGVTAVDDGGGVAKITIPGATPTPSTEQVFRYAVTGAEGNPFPVALPAARASANYNVQIQFGGPVANAFKDYRPLIASFAVGAFNVECGAAPEAGDILMLTVEDLT